MFAKIFTQIFDSSIVERPETRFTFMDFLVLSDCNGVVDMTHEAIARRTNRPLSIIRETIAELEGPDTQSRSPDLNGARIRRLDEHRDWGWEIVNYGYFRKLASEEQRRQKTKARTRRYREKPTAKSLEINGCDAPVTHCDAPKRLCDAFPSPSSSVQDGVQGKEAEFDRDNGLPDSEWIARLQNKKLYEGIDIAKELGKAVKWYNNTPGTTLTRRRFLNWLNDAEKPMSAPPRPKTKIEKEREEFLARMEKEKNG